MKKIYIEPDLEILNIFLDLDVLAGSTEATEDPINPDGDQFPDLGDDDFIIID